MSGTVRSQRQGGAAVADRPTDAVWLSALRTPRRTPVTRQAGHPAEPAVGAVSGLPGAVTDLVLTSDGRSLVAAHYGDDAVSVIDVATLEVTATAEGVAEPFALAVADRVYASCAGQLEDSVVAIDPAAGVELAAKGIAASGRGLAVSPGGDTLYVARCVDDDAAIAVIDVESGGVRTIPVAKTAGATVDTVRINADGTRLYAALTTESGAALLTIDTRTEKVVGRIPLAGAVGDIALHRDGRRAVVTGWTAKRGGLVAVLDVASGRVNQVIEISGQPTQLVLSRNRAYVVHGDGETADVAVIDLATGGIVDSIRIGRPVSCVAVSRDGGRLYIADYEGVIIATDVGSTGAQLRAAS